MNNLNYYLYWTTLDGSSFISGAVIEFDKDRSVHYSAPYKPTGVTIQSWKSHTTYWNSKSFPKLPLLIPGKEYQLDFDIEMDPKQSLFVKVRYFDRYKHDIGQEIVNSEGKIIQVPSNMYSYEISLLDFGNKSFKFKHIHLASI